MGSSHVAKAYIVKERLKDTQRDKEFQRAAEVPDGQFHQGTMHHDGLRGISARIGERLFFFVVNATIQYSLQIALITNPPFVDCSFFFTKVCYLKSCHSFFLVKFTLKI